MSDDGYYQDDDGFDDFHDMLYDADPDNDLADDLAEHAAHSPVWQDNPTEELRDYFSDWDYYSDDYFDDDPKLLNGVSHKGGSQKQQQPAKRGRKRKLSEAREQQELGQVEISALASCLKGTVWKSRSPEPAAGYKQGVDKPVALLLSAEIMNAAYNKRQGFGGRRLAGQGGEGGGGDESWANNLSLADMGLKSDRTMSMHEKAALDGEEDGVDSADIEEQAIDEQDMIDEEAVEAETMITEPYRVEIQTEPNPIDSGKVQTEIDRGPSKRQKMASEEVLTEGDSNIPPFEASRGQQETDQPEVLSKGPEAARRGKGRASKAETASQTHEQEQEQEQEQTKIAESKPLDGNSRKRKLNASEPSATGPTTSSRAKRVATTKSSAEAKATIVTAAASRPSRHKKK